MPRKKKSTLTELCNNIDIWRKNSPLLYDCIYEKKLDCPSYACTFGNLLNESKDFNKYRLFQSRATNANYLKDKHIWQGLPHALLICNAYIPNMNSNNNIHFEEIKRIIHPGPILRIKQMHRYPQIVATHTQHKYVFLWNTSTQHDREMVNNSDPNTPELILKGHKKDAVYALDFSTHDFGVASGSKDNRICIWNICDYESILSSRNEPDKKERFVPLSKPSPKLKPRIILKGHTNEVSDVLFSPYSPTIIGSVSYDKTFKIWDIRINNTNNNNNNNVTYEIEKCKHTMNNLCDSEITNLSWNLFNHNYILIACKNGNIKLLDIRNMSNHNVVKQFNAHTNQITSLQWNPCNVNSNYFLSSSFDGNVFIWDINKNQNQNNSIVFKHIGHMNNFCGQEVIHSASWIKNTNDSWCVVSTSSPKPFVPFFWSSNSSSSNQSNVNTNINNDVNISDGGIMHIFKPSILLKINHNNIMKHLKEKKAKKFVDDLDMNSNEKKKITKNKKHIECNNNNKDVDITMIDINKNNNNSNNNDTNETV